MSAEITDTFCVLPFVQTVVRTDGLMSPCCNMTGTVNIKDQDIAQFWQGSEISHLRNLMLQGNEPIPVCNKCYQDEQLTNSSMRTHALKDYNFFSKKYYTKLVEHHGYLNKPFPSRVELHLGNLCNLKCLTCRPEDSSAFLAENKILKISNHQQTDYQLDNAIVQHNIKLALENNIDILDLRGGESMLMPSVKQALVDLPSDHQINTLRIQTNATVLDDQWKSIFDKFSKIEIMLSIDAYGDDNHYVRYPSIWKEIESNVDYYLSTSKFKVYVNCTVSNLNFLLIDKLIDWCREKNIYFHYYLLNNPSQYQFTNLPIPLFDLGKKRLNDYPEVSPLLSAQPNNNQWRDFCSTITSRDNYRKNSIFDVLPEFRDFWQ